MSYDMLARVCMCIRHAILYPSKPKKRQTIVLHIMFTLLQLEKRMNF